MTNDPSKTLTIRRGYARDLRGVLKALSAVIREAVADEDVFAIEAAAVAAHSDRSETLFTPDRPGGFDFPRDPQKVRAFDTWLDNQLTRGILEPNRTGNAYIERAYTQGVSQAGRDLNRVGWLEGAGSPVEAVVRRPTHRDTLETAFTRNYRQLRGFSADMGANTSRVLADGLSRGAGPNEIARDLRGVIGTGGPSGATGAQARATMIARTESLNAYNTAAEARYREHGVEWVEVVLGSSPCDRCESLWANNPHRLSTFVGTLPYHPRCTCSTVPMPPDFSP